MNTPVQPPTGPGPQVVPIWTIGALGHGGHGGVEATKHVPARACSETSNTATVSTSMGRAVGGRSSGSHMAPPYDWLYGTYNVPPNLVPSSSGQQLRPVSAPVPQSAARP